MKFINKSRLTEEYSNRINEKSKNDWRFALDLFLLQLNEDISKQLERRNINKSQLAEIVGTSRSYVTQLLNGKPNLRFETFFKLCFSIGLIPKTVFEPIENENYNIKQVERLTETMQLSQIIVKTSKISDYETVTD
jgi:transcriptional regulator with XRE-family HTH domain